MASKVTTDKDNQNSTPGDQATPYAGASKSPQTLKIYASHWKQFQTFVREQGQPALPASPQTIIDYIAALVQIQAKPATIKVKLAAVSWAHHTANLPDPTDFEIVRAALANIKQTLGTTQDKKDPITTDDLRRLVETLDPMTTIGKRDRALLLIGFAGAFRRSELVALDIADVQANDNTIKIMVRGKTDQQGEEQLKVIPGITDPAINPALALRAWLDTASIKSGAIFRQIDKYGNIKDTRLSAQSVALVIKRAAERAGLNPRNLSGHSLRAGFITSAARAGVESRDIMAQSGHKSEATMRSYIRDVGQDAERAVRAAFGIDISSDTTDS